MARSASGLEFNPLGGALGVEVSGLDLSRPIEPEDRERLLRAYDDHLLLSLRCPGLSGDAQLRFAEIFGPLFDERPGEFLQYVSNVRDDRIIDEGALLYHSDLAFTPIPVLGLSLFALEIPESGAQTSFANAVRAWGRLPKALRERLSRLHARHLFDLTTQRGDVPYREAELPAAEPRAEHPVCMRDPRSGREILYVSRMQTDRIVELPPAESADLLARVFVELYAPDNVYEHQWEEGDLLVWNNRALQHARPEMPEGEARTLRRVTLATAGVASQVEGFRYPKRRRGEGFVASS